MSKQITGPDGRSYAFPDDASEAEILQFFESQEQGTTNQRRATAQAAQAFRRGPQRTFWERFGDRAENSYTEGPMGGLARWMAGRQAPGQMTQRDPETGQVVASRNVSAEEATRITEGLSQYERDRRQALATRTQGDEWYRAPDTPFGLGLSAATGGVVNDRTLAGVATLGGEFFGAALDPTSWVSSGRTLLAKMATSGAYNAGADVISQGFDLATDVQDRYDVGRTAIAAGLGIALQGVGELATTAGRTQAGDLFDRLFPRPEVNPEVREALIVGDRLNAPAFSALEVPPTLPRSDPEATRVVTHPETGEQITLRGPGTFVDQVEGGPQPGDYIEGGRVWRANQPAPTAEVDAPEVKPTTLEQAHAPARYIDPASPEGQALHADNKLVGEDGQPVVFYHGTLNQTDYWPDQAKPRPFEQFDPGLRLTGAGGADSNRAFFMSTSERTAKSYAGSSLSNEAYDAKYAAEAPTASQVANDFVDRIDPDKKMSWQVADAMAYYLRDWQDAGTDYHMSEVTRNLTDAGKTPEEIDSILYDLKAEKANYDALRAEAEAKIKAIEEDQNNWRIAPNGWVGKFYGVMKNPLEVDFEGGHYNEYRYMQLLDQMEADGHDGIIIRNVQDGGGKPSDVYLFPDADQLRPAQPRLQGMVSAAPPRADLQARWEALDFSERFEVGLNLLKKYTSRLLSEAGIAGTVKDAAGAWEGAPEPTVRIDLDDNVWGEDVLIRLARLFNQDSVVAISREPHPDYIPRDVITVDLGDLDPADLPRIVEALDAAGHGSTLVDRRLVIADLREDASTDLFEEIGDIIDGLGEFPTVSINKTQSHVRFVGKFEEPNASNPKQDAEPGDNGGNPGGSERDRLLEDELAADFDAELSRIERQRAEAEAAAGGSGGGEPPRDGGLAPFRDPEDPSGPGDGFGGWEDVDWGARKSPERVAAAIRHLDGLKKWIKPEAVSAFLRLIEGQGIKPADEGVYINERWVDWEAVDRNPEDILGFTNAIGDIFADVYARAGTASQSWSASERVMKQMGYTMSDLIKTHADITGEGGLTRKSGALRDMALAADKDAFDHIQAVLNGLNEGKKDAAAITRAAESLQRAILMSAMDAGAASEIARALNFRKRLGKPKFAVNDLQVAADEISSILNKGENLDEAGLKGVFEELSKSYKQGGSAKLRDTVKKMQELGFWDYVTYYSTASLLSAPTTHIKNALAPVHALFMIGERYLAAGIGAARVGLGLGSKERVTFREALAYSTGMGQAMAEGLSLAGQAFKRGAPVLDTRSGVMDNDGSPIPFQFSKQRLDEWKAKPLSPKTWADAFGVGLFELQRTVGFRVSVAFDEFYKALGTRMELNSLAYREAAYRSSLAPLGSSEGVYRNTLDAMLQEPTAAAHKAAKEFFRDTGGDAEGVYAPGSREEEMALILRSIDHRQMALDHARLMTFQNAGPIVKKIDDAIRAIPVIKAGWVNFIRTPTMVLKAGLIDRTPAAALVALGEMTSKTRRPKHIALFKALAMEEAALARGGAEADIVLAQQALGYATLYTLWMYWASGNVTGKQTQEQREKGILDYSVRLPNGTWVQYSGIPVIGDMLGLVADTGEGLRHVDIDDDGMMTAVGVVAAALRNNVFNKSFAKGISDFMEMLKGGDPNASMETMGRNMGSALTDAFQARAVPAASLLRRTAQTMDPVTRDARDFNEKLFSRLPLLSESLAARRDFMGRPLVRTEGQTGIFQAFQTSQASPDRLEAELGDLGARLGEDFRIGMPSRKINEAEITPQEYSRLLETQGQLYRIRGRNMEEALRELIDTPEYQRSLPEARALDIKKVIERYREGANRAVKNPSSPHYMGETVRRTAAERLREEARALRLTQGQLFARGRRYGLQPDDPEAQALREALFPTQP